MGHVLGIGLIWSRLDLLRDPASETSTPDTHFTGPLPIAAFDEAGGTGYGGAKVPVDDIWRGPVIVVDPDGRIVRVIPR